MQGESENKLIKSSTIVFCSILGGILMVIAVNTIISVAPNMNNYMVFDSSPFSLSPLYDMCIGVLTSLCFGAYVAGSLAWIGIRKLKQHQIIGRRSYIFIIVGFILSFLPLGVYLNSKMTNFPAKASIRVRDQWALNKFQEPYKLAKQSIQNSSAIREDIGDIVEIAPAVNASNFCDTNPRGVNHFTLEVKGEKGIGICSVQVFRSEEGGWHVGAYEFKWEYDAKTILLTKDGAYDKQGTELEKSIRRKEKFEENLKRLYKQKRYADVVKAYENELHTAKSVSGTKEICPIIAHSYEVMGDYKKASVEYVGAAWLESGGGGDHKKAKQYIEKAIELNPEDNYVQRSHKDIYNRIQRR